MIHIKQYILIKVNIMHAARKLIHHIYYLPKCKCNDVTSLTLTTLIL